ncbi:paternally-expressed gene 3 protein-like [Eriocheir sinensis]|uniref:paternally-expressed gene 3 protein-like n=1 Tax=Eriocheir sinensis TaxID=95602 RepID=UPI0021C5ED04|nr:paternally-expressed gene 3 protein-like [Eriocheir sinensis]
MLSQNQPGGLQHPAGGPAVLALPGQPSTTTFTRQPSTTTFTRQPSTTTFTRQPSTTTFTRQPSTTTFTRQPSTTTFTRQPSTTTFTRQPSTTTFTRQPSTTTFTRQPSTTTFTRQPSTTTFTRQPSTTTFTRQPSTTTFTRQPSTTTFTRQPSTTTFTRQPSTTTFTRQPSTTTFTRQPLQRNNGRITGYLIFLTMDQTVSDWVTGEVTGDWLTLTVHGLTPSRKYLHKMHSHNVKGFGPFSSVESFTTLPAVDKSIGEPQAGVWSERPDCAGDRWRGRSHDQLGAFLATTLYCRGSRRSPGQALLLAAAAVRATSLASSLQTCGSITATWS